MFCIDTLYPRIYLMRNILFFYRNQCVFLKVSDVTKRKGSADCDTPRLFQESPLKQLKVLISLN